MRTKMKQTGTASSIPAGLACGALTATGITLVSAVAAANLVNREILGWENIGYAVLVILMLSSWLGAVVSAEKIKRQRLAMCITSGLIYFGILLIVTGLFFGGQYSGVGETALLIFCGSMLGVLTGYRGKTRRNNRKNRLYNR